MSYSYSAIFSEDQVYGIYPCNEAEVEAWLEDEHLFEDFAGCVNFISSEPLEIGKSYCAMSIEIFDKKGGGHTFVNFYADNRIQLAEKANNFFEKAHHFVGKSTIPKIRSDFKSPNEDESLFGHYTVIVISCEGILKKTPV